VDDVGGALDGSEGGVDAELVDPDTALELELELELPPVVWKLGGPIAVEGSTSAPVPYATVCPSDCSVCCAGVELPSAAAIVKRPVQV